MTEKEFVKQGEVTGVIAFNFKSMSLAVVPENANLEEWIPSQKKDNALLDSIKADNPNKKVVSAKGLAGQLADINTEVKFDLYPARNGRGELQDTNQAWYKGAQQERQAEKEHRKTATINKAVARGKGAFKLGMELATEYGYDKDKAFAMASERADNAYNKSIDDSEKRARDKFAENSGKDTIVDGKTLSSTITDFINAGGGTEAEVSSPALSEAGEE